MTDQAAAPHADPERAFDGQYQLGSEIGAGALGVVYRGVDEKLDKPVAIKVWHARFDEGTTQREQYDAEARALTALEHPNLVAITDYGIAGQAPYLVMELLEGERLDARFRSGALRSSQAQTLMQSVLRALGYMHMRGVVHRNLKPDNVLLAKADAGETLKLLDLGLESLAANTNAAGSGATAPVQPPSVYDAPEREQGVDPDGRADVYAAGVLMLQMLSGQEPSRDMLRAAGDNAPDVLSGLLPNAASEVKAFIAKAVANERSARFGNGDQMLRALLELPTPWMIGEPEEEAPAPVPVMSGRPMSQPVHVDFGSSDTVALPAAEGGGEAAASTGDAEFELRPIGLVAKLRARKKLVMIVLGVVGVGIMGSVAAAVLASRAETQKEAQELAVAKKAAAILERQVAAARAKEAAPVLEHAYHAEEAEEIDEGEEGAAGAAGVVGKPAPPAAAVTPPAATPPAAAKAEPSKEPPAAVAAHAAAKVEEAAAKGAEKPAEPPPAAAPHGGGFVPFSPFGDTPRPEVPPPSAAEPAKPEAVAKHDGEHEVVAGAANAKANGEPESPPVPPPTAAGEPAQPAAPKKPPTPQELGAERHVDPDQTEIRQMLALAIKSSPRAAAADPWDIAVPDSLQALRTAIARGERGTAGNIKTLRRYNAANPDDVYGHLLLAGFYGNRGYALDALDQYDIAYRIDSSSRGAPEMLKHALKMVAQGVALTDAQRFVQRVYGREASSQLNQLLRARETSAAAASRLRQLQARLGTVKSR